jgi:hypothetical protein
MFDVTKAGSGRRNECGEVVGTMQSWPLSDLASLAMAGGMDR